MSIKLKSTHESAAMAWKKFCIHGRAGAGKTALAATALPLKPLVIITERSGEETLQPSTIESIYGPSREDILYDLDYVEAYSPEEFEEAVAFAKTSDHNLIIFDSFSKAARLILKQAKSENAHGLKAYGAYNDTALALIEALMELPKHVCFISHTTRTQDENSGEILYSPSFEGKGFGEKFLYEVSHIFHLETAYDDDGESFRALRCHQGDTDKLAKNRGGRLNELEEPHLGRLILKLQGKVEAPKKKVKKSV
jgi:AAA domain